MHDKRKFHRAALLIPNCCLAALLFLLLATAASAQTPDAMPPNQDPGALTGEGDPHCAHLYHSLLK